MPTTTEVAKCKTEAALDVAKFLEKAKRLPATNDGLTCVHLAALGTCEQTALHYTLGAALGI